MPPPYFHLDQHALYRENLEEGVKQPCQVPGCKHEGHEAGGGPRFLTGRCHPNQGQRLVEVTTPDNKKGLAVGCRLCERPVVTVYVDRIEGLLKSPCHHWGVEAMYVGGSGRITILCADPVCRKEIGFAITTADPDPSAPTYGSLEAKRLKPMTLSKYKPRPSRN